MRIERRFTIQGKTPYEGLEFRKATSEIKNPDGSIVFRLADIAVPAAWSQVASDILPQKYFRKAGVPAALSTKSTFYQSIELAIWARTAPRLQRLGRPVA